MNRSIKNLTLAAMFLALGLVLPFLSGQIPQIGSKLLPMHIPVFFPAATAMAFELMTYGALAGLLYSISR